jgi:hypothetical protein
MLIAWTVLKNAAAFFTSAISETYHDIADKTLQEKSFNNHFHNPGPTYPGPTYPGPTYPGPTYPGPGLTLRPRHKKVLIIAPAAQESRLFLRAPMGTEYSGSSH